MSWVTFLILSTTSPADFVTVVPEKAYFESRKIDQSLANMLKLASADPGDPQTQVRQLLALRVIGQSKKNLEAEGKLETALQLLEQIAAGKKAQDRFGFSKAHASLALAQLTGKAPERSTMPPQSLRADAWSWFPGSVNLALAIDSRGGPAGDLKQGAVIRTFLGEQMPPRERESFFDAVDAIGNFRIHRVSLGYAPDPTMPRDGTFYIRLTGQYDHARFAGFARKGLETAQIESQEGVTVFHVENDVSFALLGDTDVVFVAGDADRKAKEALADVLAVRAGKQPSALEGVLGKELKEVPEEAFGVLRGTLPLEMQQAIKRGPFTTCPESIRAHLIGEKGQILLKFDAPLPGEDDAASFAKAIMDLREKGLTHLKNAPAEAPAELVGEVHKSLESLKIKAEGKSVAGEVSFYHSIGETLFMLLVPSAERRDGEAPKPVPGPAEGGELEPARRPN